MYTWREHIELYHMLWKTNFKGSRWVSEIVLEHLILVNSPSFALSPLRISVCSFDHRFGRPCEFLMGTLTKRTIFVFVCFNKAEWNRAELAGRRANCAFLRNSIQFSISTKVCPPSLKCFFPKQLRDTCFCRLTPKLLDLRQLLKQFCRYSEWHHVRAELLKICLFFASVILLMFKLCEMLQGCIM